MSQKDVEVVRRAFSGEKGLVEAAKDYWHPQIEYVEDPRFPGASTYKGRDAVISCWEGYMEVMGDDTDIEVTVEDVFDAGERQVPLIRFRGNSRATGIPFDHVWGYVVRVEQERIVYLRAFYEPRDALGAAGLSE
jgi:ketosteroid isomerase-like protein